jgi:hypothetical protein
MYTQGISGPVIFNIRPGTYNEQITSTFINGISSVNTITLQSELLDSTSVIITTCATCYYIFDLSYVGFIKFKSLTITTAFYDAIRSGNHIEIESCVISAPHYAIDYGYGSCWLKNNSITGEVNSFNGTDFTILTRNTFYGGVEISGAIIDCENNKFFGPHFAITYSDSIIRVLMNEVHSYFSMTSSAGDILIQNNMFLDSLQSAYIGGSDNSKVIHNTFVGDFSIHNSEHSLLDGNIFNSSYNSIGFIDTILVINNLFSGNLYMHHSFYSNVFNNNFSAGTNLSMGYSAYCNIENNNFSSEVSGFWGWNNIANNNYFPSGGAHDAHPYNLNPQYVSSSDLHAQNMYLNGQGVFHPQVVYDIDSVLRPNPPSMGANEVCISADTINIWCGDSIALSLCNSPASGNFNWSPSSGLKYSQSSCKPCCQHKIFCVRNNLRVCRFSNC